MKPDLTRWSRETLDKRLLEATSIQFETDADIAAAIDSIMGGRFKGALIHHDVKLHSFRSPSILGTKLHDGRRIGRFTHGDLRIARRYMGGYHYDGGFDFVDRTRLAEIFASGGVVENGPGHQALEDTKRAFWQQVRKEKNEEIVRLKTESLSQVDDERKAALELSFDRLRNRSPEALMHAVVSLAATSTASLLEAVAAGSDSYSHHAEAASSHTDFTQSSTDFGSASP